MLFRLPLTVMPGSLSLARGTFTFAGSLLLHRMVFYKKFFGNPGQKIRTPGFYV